MVRPAALAEQQDRVDAAVTAIAAAPAEAVYAAPMVVLSLDRPPRPLIGLHAARARPLRLDIDETILVAVVLEQLRPCANAEALAAGLRAAAATADLLELGHRMRILRSPTGTP